MSNRGVGLVDGIFISEAMGEPLVPVESGTLIANVGLNGDRYSIKKGFFSYKGDGLDRHLTLIEREEIDRLNAALHLNLEPADFRRNIVTRNIRLNDLVGKRFLVGSAVCVGMRLCEPCKRLNDLTGHSIAADLVGRGGLRVRVICSGTVHIGATIKEQLGLAVP